MATKEVINDGITAAIPIVENTTKIPTVTVFIPLPPGTDQEDIDAGRVDPYEHVTVNGKTTYVKRGENVDVSIPVYMQLRNKYPRI